MLDIPRIREDFPALQHGIYLHTAGIGMNARPVLAEVTDRWQFFFENGPWLQSRRDERFLHKQRTREALARFFNVPADTISMVNNVSNSISMVVSGLPLAPGDEIITSNEEDDALWLPLYNIGRKRHGAVVHHMPVGATPEESLANFEALLSPRTKLVAMSHVTQDRGTELPVAEMCRLARERARSSTLTAGRLSANSTWTLPPSTPTSTPCSATSGCSVPMGPAVSTWPNACATCCRFPGAAATWLST